jgi:hypothetical protein
MTTSYKKILRWLCAGFFLSSCGTSEPQAGIGDDPGGIKDGGPPVVIDTTCPNEGQVRECGRVEHIDGNYVTCSMGHQTCQNGHWTICTGDHYVKRSLPTRRLDSNGAHTLAAAGPVCSNICDPYCVTQQPDPSTVDAAGIRPGNGGGITLAPEGGSEGGTTEGGSGCSGLQCQIASCAAGSPTTVSGVVYDPAGKNPLYNAYVYVPRNASDVPPAFGSGASCDTCGGTGSFNALQVAQTDAAGRFTLTNVPSGANIPIVVVMGKWRREIVLTTVSSCRDNTVSGNCTAPSAADCMFRLPKNQRDGYDPVARTYTKADIPQIAIVSGGADPFDCLLLKAGIDPAEFGDNASTKRVHYYESDARPGNSLNAGYGSQIVGSTLWNNFNSRAPSMMSYDVILLPCEGAAINKQTTGNTPYANLIRYANAGGRSFITHYGYVWLEYPAAKGYVAAPDNWGSVATWTPTGSTMTSTVNTQDPLTGIVNVGFPKGGTFATWLQNVSATTTPGQLTIHEGRQDLTTIGANAQSWMTATNTRYPLFPTYTNLFTFNTPWAAAAANQCGRVVYSDFHVSANALVGGTNQCLTNTDCGYTATCVGATPGSIGRCSEPCRTAADCPNSLYSCQGATVGTCQTAGCRRDRDCGGGRTCDNGVCSCSSSADCGNGTCGGATCTPISCTSSSQCGAGTCSGGTCNSVACHGNGDCGLGTCGGTGRDGTCTAGAACHKDADCGRTGTCGTGTGASIGTCSTSGGACHKNADCDSGGCGSTTANKGTCSLGGGTTCHKNADCDSNSCGSGSGSSTGACAVGGGTTCHKNADCDSNSCGNGTGSSKGTCAVAGGTACHKNGDCDSNSCGSGTGSTAGTCNVGNATTCHADTDCDSGSCGSGTGASTGTCTAGTCTRNRDCGSGGRCTLGVCTAGTCSVNSDCGTVALLGICTGATCSSKNCGDDASCGVSRLCNGAKCSNPAACAVDTDCTKSQSCSGAKCSTPAACAVDTDCTKSQQCTGAKCSTPPACSVDTDCAKSQLCNGAKCASQTCANDAACGASRLCNGAKCSRSACSNDSQCPTGVACSNATCTPPATCGNNTDCGTGGRCSNAMCSANACSSSSDCGSGSTCHGSCMPRSCVTGADCLSGICNAGVCGCNANEQCATSQTCVGATTGSCQKACVTDAECAPDTCYNGTCGGCRTSNDCHDNSFSPTCTGVTAGSYGTCSVYTPGEFPGACRQGNLSSQEKALEFMFFDLTACVSPDNAPPPTPMNTPPWYNPATFTEDFVASCPKATGPIWREFDWQANIPSTASIVFEAQSGDTTATLLPATPLALATATTTTNTGPTMSNYDVAFIDTGRNGSGAFNTASPPVVSRDVLRLRITLNPTTDHLQAPTLVQWKVQYDCVPDQ